MKTSIATVSLSGELTAKLDAIAEVGFDGYELFENDLTFSSTSPVELRDRNEELGLELFALQPFRDFEGLLDSHRSRAFERAECKFDLMERLGPDRLLIPSTVSPHATDNRDRCVQDLRELGDRAHHRGFRIGFEALAWGRHVRDWTEAWEIVQQVDHPAVGLVLDTYHLFVRGNPVAPLRDVPAEKITLVQLADAPSLDMEVLRHSRHLRNFPGQGDYPIVDFLHQLLTTGYDDVLSHEIFNDDFRIAPPKQTAVDGYRSMMWLEEAVGATSSSGSQSTDSPTTRWTSGGAKPPPAEIDGIAFVEFAATDETAREELHSFFTAAGFTHTHRHRTKRVDLYASGGAYLAINTEPDSYAQSFADRHGAGACAVGFTSADPNTAAARATSFLAPEIESRPGDPGEAPLRAVTGVGDMLHYFVSSTGPQFVRTDFDTVHNDEESAGPVAVDPDLRFDHIGIAVAPHELLSALLFYRAALGFGRRPTHELVDPHGLVMSRAVQSPTGNTRIALTTSAGGDTSPERFRSATQGAGLQHVAIAASSIVEVVATIDPAVVLSIPDNYYEDLETRFRLDPGMLRFVRDNNILYDEDEAGTYFHLYTSQIHGVFFEFVERYRYEGFGAANAPVRLAAQARATTRQSTAY